jgi:hypothetical protein
VQRANIKLHLPTLLPSFGDRKLFNKVYSKKDYTAMDD